MNKNIIISVLLDIKGIGNKKIQSISLKTLNQIQTADDIYNLYKELSQSNSRIDSLSNDEINRLVEHNLYIYQTDQNYGIQSVTIWDESYPKKLLSLKNPPVLLYVKGNIDILSSFSIAIIGTRDITDYGKKIGYRFGEFLAEHHIPVISGLAKGCDTYGHLGCLKKDGMTAAVLGTPLTSITPVSNNQIAMELLEKDGCLVSEYKTGTKTTPYHFVNRDRIQAALCDGVIVVECGIKSGTMHTIEECMKEQKPVGCFNYTSDHYLTYEQSRGNQYLIQNKDACCLYDIQSILSFIDKCKNKPTSLALF